MPNTASRKKEEDIMRKFIAAVSISRTTAQQTPVRCAQFLRTAGTDPAIGAALQLVGFGPEDRKEGWSLLTRASESVPEVAPPADSPALEASRQLDTWRGLHVNVARAALRRLHPLVEAFVFDSASTNAVTTAVVAVGQFLDRLDALESSPKRKSTRRDDHAALATLVKRGITEQARKAARHLINVIESAAVPQPAINDPQLGVARAQAMADLHAWLSDWTECARSVIKRRDQLIRLGIGKRQKRSAAPPVVATPVPVVTTPPAIAELPAAAVRMLPAAALNGESQG